MWVRDLDMVVTTSGYVWHNDLHKQEVIVGGGTVEMPVRVDRAGVAKGLLLAKTKAKLECTARVNETMIFIYIWHSENMGNLHEGLYAIYMALKETGHLEDPIRLGFVERWGPNNQDFINLAYPTAVQPSILLGEIAEKHVVDFKSSTPPDVIDGLCVRELVVIKDQFPIFPPPSKRSLIGYRKYLFATFKVHAPVEHATKLEEAFHIPAVATDDAPPTSPAAKPRVVLLKRTKDKRVLNSDELVKALRTELGDSADVVQVMPDRLSVDEMIKLMQSTTVLIGVHGSGLGQLWFLPRTSSMIVLHPPGTDDLLSRVGLETGAPWLVDYLSLAQKMSLNAYAYQEKKITESPDGEECGEGRWGLYCSYVKDFEVTTDELVDLVRQAFDAALARKDETFD